MASSQKKNGPHKSADTGRFVSAAYAAKHPKSTYKLGGSKKK
ncbi:hypothetical protein FHR79_000641 [Micrococcus aloeverae]|uniref:Multidrug transporter n=1 Tax=Micrococcus aloeverae TaxID=1391911 RepID=A0ABR6DWY5_9MICC|nr:hypothetical protein [Micrococcus aloeverae]MBA9080553.1 hypothetical protein [Micrococcus aloeverae]